MDPQNQQTEPKPGVIKKDTISVVIRNRSGIVLAEEVKALSSLNETGPFDVLPMHENFISIIKDTITIHKKNGKNEIKISNGIIRVHENQINIFLEVGVSENSAGKTEPPSK
ncbi:MAG: hypothetical protein M1450_01850 [Patescibacteria group bacterium]|nr:hypothetical protein [Patescibacteria group bacterium]